MSTCTNAIGSLVDSFVGNDNEAFNNVNGTPKVTVGMLVSLVLYLILVLFVGTYLWDNVMVKVCSVCKPMPSLLHFLGLVLLIDMLLPKRL